MTFPQVAIILSFVLYCIIAVGNLRDRDYPHALIWGAYALSQTGFLWYELTKRTVE
jgi:hypothetical protein